MMKMHLRSSISLSLSLSKFLFCRSNPLNTSKRLYHQVLTQTPQNAPKPQFPISNTIRPYSVETDRAVDEINLKFAEAREEIESAMDSKETVYFNEEAESARDAVKEVLDLYESLFRRLPQKEQGVIQRSMGLKIHQLKAELDQLNH